MRTEGRERIYAYSCLSELESRLYYWSTPPHLSHFVSNPISKSYKSVTIVEHKSRLIRKKSLFGYIQGLDRANDALWRGKHEWRWMILLMTKKIKSIVLPSYEEGGGGGSPDGKTVMSIPWDGLIQLCLPKVGQSGRYLRSTRGHTWFASYSSMNCWSIDLDLGCENLRYSSKIDVWLQCWAFRKQPMRQPVLCYVIGCLLVKGAPISGHSFLSYLSLVAMD